MEGCGRERKYISKNMCAAHYKRLKNGTPLDAPLGSLKRKIRELTEDVIRQRKQRDRYHWKGIQEDRVGLRMDHKSGKIPLCERCLEHKARNRFSFCMTCSSCVWCDKHKPLRGSNLCEPCREKQRALVRARHKTPQGRNLARKARQKNCLLLCSFPGCGSHRSTGRLCSMHHSRKYSGKKMDAPPRLGAMDLCRKCRSPLLKRVAGVGLCNDCQLIKAKGCTFEGCGRELHSKMLCNAHSKQLRRTGILKTVGLCVRCRDHKREAGSRLCVTCLPQKGLRLRIGFLMGN